MAGMAMDLSLLPDQQDSAPSLMIQEVMDDHALDRWAEVCTNGFNMPREVLDVMAEAILPGGFGEQASIRCFLAYQNEIPVACSALSLGAGVAGIYSVTTLPVARKQGIGAVVTAHPLYIARDLGYRVGILQASSMGFPVYQRLGFEECCSFALYA